MSVEGIKGSNKLTSKEIKRVEPPKSDPKSGGKAKSSDIAKIDVKVDSVDISKVDQENIDGSGGLTAAESFGMSLTERVEAEAETKNDQGLVSNSVDSLDISVKDPELTARIRELVEKIKQDRSSMSKRIEAARVLIMKRAYDDNKELVKTAEAILRGEDVESIETD